MTKPIVGAQLYTIRDFTKTIEDVKESLKQAVVLILEDRIEDATRGLPEDTIQDTIAV